MPESLIIFYIFIVGCIIGSFLNVCIYRIPLDYTLKELIWSRSFCPNCRSKIKFYDNIPIISFFILKARCRRCKYPIPVRYIIVEVLTPFSIMVIYYKFSFDFYCFLLYTFFICLLIIISFIDIEHYIIPDKITYTGIIIGVLSCLKIDHNRFNEVILGGIILGGIMYLLRLLSLLILKKEGIGGGDVMLSILIGVYLGHIGGILGLAIGALIGLITSIILILLKKKRWGEYVAFGPYLSTGAFLSLMLKNFF